MANTPTSDLTTQALYTDGNTNWQELGDYGAGGADETNTESFIQGSSCVSQQVATNKTGAASGIYYDNAADVTAFTDNSDVFFFWWQFLFPGAINDYNDTQGQTAPSSNSPGTASGYFIGIGSSDTNYNWYAVGGADFGRYPYGGWQNVAIDPTRTASFVDGTPTASTYQVFGFLPNITSAPSRGQSNVADAIRWGRGLLQYTGGTPAGTFQDIADTNDLNANRWGLFQDQGSFYLFKGRLELGTTASSLLFTDSNKNINIDDTRQVYAGFNLIQINNVGSVVTWDNITFSKLRYISSLPFDDSKGDFEVNNGANVTITNSAFVDMNEFDLGANVTIEGTAWRRSGQTRQNSATISSSTFDLTTGNAAIVADDLSSITDSTFVWNDSGIDNHAIEIPSTLVNRTITLTGIEFTNYPSAGGATANAMIYNNSGAGLVTINAVGCTVDGVSGNITVRNGTSATTTVNQVVSNIVTVADVSGTAISGAQVAVYNSTTDAEIANGQTNGSGEFAFTSSPGTAIYVRIRKSTTGSTRYVPVETPGNTGTNGTTIAITLVEDLIASA